MEDEHSSDAELTTETTTSDASSAPNGARISQHIQKFDTQVFFNFTDAAGYFLSAFKKMLYCFECSFWIRRSTGALCTDLVPDHSIHPTDFGMEPADWTPRSEHMMSVDGPAQEAVAISALTIGEYHGLCFTHCSRTWSPEISTEAAARLGAVIRCSSSIRFDESVEIASLSDPYFHPESDKHWDTHGATGEVMSDGRSRYKSCDVFSFSFAQGFGSPDIWLGQANHIFSRLSISSDHQDYVVVDFISLRLELCPIQETPPSGYLFLCSEKDLQPEPFSFRWPDCPAYWALDPSGVERLSTEDAQNIGFPAIQLTTNISGIYYDATVYSGIREFHQAKGFDPDSQDIARNLDDPLFQLSGALNTPCRQEEDDESDDPDTENNRNTHELAPDESGEPELCTLHFAS
ncbi:hypothetical protein DFH09DRAFT_1450618 [Mycena vulgaris]|nr:hypothetical protein DFH09DRAFT_1450618 [Mycena vulgaris]